MARPKSAAARSIRGNISSPIPHAEPLNDPYQTYIPPYLLQSQNIQFYVPHVPQTRARDSVQLHSRSLAAQNALKATEAVTATTTTTTTATTTETHVETEAVTATAAESTAMETIALPADNSDALGSSMAMRKPLLDNSTSGNTSRLSDAEVDANAPPRKRSSFRKALGRLFGRRSKTPNQLITTIESPQRVSAPPQTTENTGAKIPRGSATSRSISMPVTEYDRALRSHSIGLDDVIAIRSARNSVATVQTRTKKQNSTSSAAPPCPLGARYIGDGKLAGLCPRPASVNEKDLNSSTVAGEHSDQIGRAITSSHERGLRRRSRSMSALPFFESTQDAQRPRSLELSKDPRGSCYLGQDPLSPLSSEFHVDDAAAIGAFDLGLSHPPRPAAPEPPSTPEQVFMFNRLVSDEKTANRRQVESITLDARVNGIENRLHILEDAVLLARHGAAGPDALDSRSQQQQPSDAPVSAELPSVIQTSLSWPSARNRHHSLAMGIPTSAAVSPSKECSETSPKDDRSPLSNGGVGAGAGHYTTTHRLSQQDIAAHRLSQQSAHRLSQQSIHRLSQQDTSARPSTDHTPRGQTPQKMQQQQRHRNSLNDEQYASILGLLESERAARMSLQAQVQQLTRQLNTFTSLYAKPSRHHFSYHPPRHDAATADDEDERSAWQPYQAYSLGDVGGGGGPGAMSCIMSHEMGASSDDRTSSSPSQHSRVYGTPSEESSSRDDVVVQPSARNGVMSLSRITAQQNRMPIV